MTSKSLTEREKIQGLAPADHKLLQEIIATGSWQQAADNLSLPRRSVREKFARNKAFREAYEALFVGDEVEATKRELEMGATGLGGLYEDAINAELTKPIQVECPKCQNKFRVFVTMMDWATKLRAGETLLKLTRILKDEKSVKVGGMVGVVHMGMDEYLALQRLKMGLHIPDHIYAKLTAAAVAGDFLVPPNPPDDRVVDAEYRVTPVEPSAL